MQSVAVVLFFEHHVVDLEKQMRIGDQHGFSPNIKSVKLEDAKKVEPRCVRGKEGKLLCEKSIPARDGCDSSARC